MLKKVFFPIMAWEGGGFIYGFSWRGKKVYAILLIVLGPLNLFQAVIKAPKRSPFCSKNTEPSSWRKHASKKCGHCCYSPED